MIRKKYKTTYASFIVSLLMLGSPCVVADTQRTSYLNEPQQSPSKSIVSGTIKDELGEPLIGVGVVVKGTTDGTVTDVDGNFTLSCSPSDVLHISYLGYIKQDITVGNKSSFVITLIEDAKVLDEIIVIGYGTTTRKSAVGAVDQVKAKLIEDRPVANLTQALQGASPSLVIQQRSGNPNDSQTNINIRGISTFNSNSPLIVIDGLVSDEGSFNKLNPADVENISILKDAGTAAIYGSRSANGVLLITTKKGKKNTRPVVKLGGMMGWQDPNILFRPVAGWQNATLKNLALTNAGKDAEFSPDHIRDLADHQNEEEWFYDQIIRTALQQNYNLSVSGGSDNTTYMVSLGYYDQESNYVGKKSYGTQRYNMRSNVTTEYGRFKVTAILAYSRNNSMKPTGSSLDINASRIPPSYYYKMKGSNGKYLINNVLSDYTPLGQLEKGGPEKKRDDYMNANVNLDFTIFDGLKLRGILGADIIAEHRFIRQKTVPFYRNENDEKPSAFEHANREASDWNNDTHLINAQILADYNKTFGKHTVSALIGATNEAFTSNANEIRFKLTDPDLGTSGGDDTEAMKESKVSLEGKNKWNISSVLGRFGYSFADKYYSEVSFRYDGSSKFAKDNRWGFFPSISLGWRISEEEFMDFYKNNIGDLKIRGSYGILGNQSIDSYDRYTKYDAQKYVYGYNNTAVTGTGFKLGKEDLKWEKTNIFDIGFDAAFLNNSLNVTFDYFHKKTTDILLKPIVPSVFGTEYPMDNIGEMKNQGWDLSVNYRLNTAGVNHSFGVSIGDAWNEVTKFEGYEKIDTSDEIGRLVRVGVPLYSYYGLKTDGLFQSNKEIETSALPEGVDVKPGDVKYVDRNGDGVIDPNDRYILGNAFPRNTFGITYGLDYKGFDFSMLVQGVGKRDMMLRGELMEPFHSNYSYVIYKHQLDFWSPTNTGAKYPRLAAPNTPSNRNNYGKGSDIYMLDGKYLRLKNIQLGYTIPKTWSMKAGMQRARVYVNAQNLFTLSKNSFIDAESSEFDNKMEAKSANSGRNYPVLKYYGFGIDIEF